MADESLFGDVDTAENEEEEPTTGVSSNHPDSTQTNGGDDENDHQPSILASLQSSPPPDALPPGWVRRLSRSQPNHAYYYSQDTGDCRWDPPYIPRPSSSAPKSALRKENTSATDERQARQENPQQPQPKPAVKSILKKKSEPIPVVTAPSDEGVESRKRGASPPADRVSKAAKSSAPDSPSPSGPKEVRVLHLLKKHRGSRRPASWRNKNITISKERAISDLKELISILKESESDPKELRATFEELARTESDCSSAKRGGDLGFFGRRKMQPAFEKASFGLKVGELSGIVETSSGVHVILRLA